MQNPLYFEDEVVRFNKFERQKDLSITKDNRSGTQKTIDHILIIYLFPTHSTALFSRSFIRKVCLYHCRHTGYIHVHVICTFLCPYWSHLRKGLIEKMESCPYWSKSIIYLFPWCSFGKTLMYNLIIFLFLIVCRTVFSRDKGSAMVKSVAKKHTLLVRDRNMQIFLRPRAAAINWLFQIIPVCAS